MEAVAVSGAGAIAAKANLGGIEKQKNNKIQVSSTKRPLYFYVNLAKRYMQQHEEVELSALGMAITTVVTIAEILKNNGLATQKKIMTSTVGMKDETKGRLVQKAKIEILMVKTEGLDNMLTAKTMTSEVAADGKEGKRTSEVATDDKEKKMTSEVATDDKGETMTSEVVADGKKETKTSEVAANGREETKTSEVAADGKEKSMTSKVAADGNEQ
ncbi:hypothetical protein NE237_012037 [Protea cynaroides]|uniref:DNA/RNA-binding protein Alba-like domain-containing protein n=1 Tax=Protea cynaroides TaxID=273540 RepID=A0A9Q0H134_9MAGN|nr:hypothetical protein NE237_012037 [Protea cynaroides]